MGDFRRPSCNPGGPGFGSTRRGRPAFGRLRLGASARQALRAVLGRQLALAVFLGLIGSGAMVWRGTVAVFSSTTSNAANSWTLGSVTLADDDSSAALFNASNLVPSSTGSNCITVTYSGNVATTVKLYVSALTDTSTIAQYVNLTVTEGTGGGFGTCVGFAAGTVIVNNVPLSTFSTNSSQYSNGVGTWAPSSSGTKVYKFTYTISAATPSAKQGTNTTATFQWETQA